MELFPSGLGIHHAGMLRKHRSLMERAFEKGYLKVTAAPGPPGSPDWPEEKQIHQPDMTSVCRGVHVAILLVGEGMA